MAAALMTHVVIFQQCFNQQICFYDPSNVIPWTERPCCQLWFSVFQLVFVVRFHIFFRSIFADAARMVVKEGLADPNAEHAGKYKGYSNDEENERVPLRTGKH